MMANKSKMHIFLILVQVMAMHRDIPYKVLALNPNIVEIYNENEGPPKKYYNDGENDLHSRIGDKESSMMQPLIQYCIKQCYLIMIKFRNIPGSDDNHSGYKTNTEKCRKGCYLSVILMTDDEERMSCISECGKSTACVIGCKLGDRFIAKRPWFIAKNVLPWLNLQVHASYKSIAPTIDEVQYELQQNDDNGQTSTGDYTEPETYFITKSKLFKYSPNLQNHELPNEFNHHDRHDSAIIHRQIGLQILPNLYSFQKSGARERLIGSVSSADNLDENNSDDLNRSNDKLVDRALVKVRKQQNGLVAVVISLFIGIAVTVAILAIMLYRRRMKSNDNKYSRLEEKLSHVDHDQYDNDDASL